MFVVMVSKGNRNLWCGIRCSGYCWIFECVIVDLLLCEGWV